MNLWASTIPPNLCVDAYCELYKLAMQTLGEIQKTQASERVRNIELLNQYYDARQAGTLSQLEREALEDLEAVLATRHQFQELLRIQLVTILGRALTGKMRNIAAASTSEAKQPLWIRMRRDWQALRQWRFESLDGKDFDLLTCLDTVRLPVRNLSMVQMIFKAWAKEMGAEPAELYEQCVALIELRSNPKMLGSVNKRFGTVFARMNAEALLLEERSAFPPRPSGVRDQRPGLAPADQVDGPNLPQVVRSLEAQLLALNIDRSKSSHSIQSHSRTDHETSTDPTC